MPNDVSSPEYTAGPAESLPLCGPRGRDGVARGGNQRRTSILAAADRRRSARRRNGRYCEVHPQRRVEMVKNNVHAKPFTYHIS